MKFISTLRLHNQKKKSGQFYYTLIYKATRMNQILSFQEDGKSQNTNEGKKNVLSGYFPLQKEER